MVSIPWRLRQSRGAGGRGRGRDRPSRFGAMGWSCRLSVVRTRRGRAARPRSPASRTRRATRWRPTRRPRTRRAAWTRGAPSLPPLSAWTRRTTSSSARLALFLAPSGRARQARVTADRHSQHPTHHPSRPDIAMLFHEPEPHRVPPPTMSAALFRMWRSILARSRSRLSRAFSAASSASDEPGSAGADGRRRGVGAPARRASASNAAAQSPAARATRPPR